MFYPLPYHIFENSFHHVDHRKNVFPMRLLPRKFDIPISRTTLEIKVILVWYCILIKMYTYGRFYYSHFHYFISQKTTDQRCLWELVKFTTISHSFTISFIVNFTTNSI